MIGAKLTADDLSGKPGFVRVAPTNSDQAKAAVALLRQDPKVRRALLIQDINKEDPFTETLGPVFIDEAEFAGLPVLKPIEEYNASSGDVATKFIKITSISATRGPTSSTSQVAVTI